jgi:hypothetical protein
MNRACPTIRKVYKVVESAAFLAPYDAYRCVFRVCQLMILTLYAVADVALVTRSFVITERNGVASSGTRVTPNYAKLQRALPVASSIPHSK